MKSRFAGDQITQILEEQSANEQEAEICQRNGISQSLCYQWKAKFHGIAVSTSLIWPRCQAEFYCILVKQRRTKMTKIRSTVTQIVKILKRVEGGLDITDFCRE